MSVKTAHTRMNTGFLTCHFALWYWFDTIRFNPVTQENEDVYKRQVSMFWEWHWYLKHCHHCHTLTPIKVWRRVQRAPFQRRLCLVCRLGRFEACVPLAHAHPSESAKPACRLHFVGGADKSAFALLSQKVTKACACRRRKERKRFMQRTISRCV